MISLKINLKKIDQSRVFKSEKTGAIYLDAVAIETPNSEYGDYMIVQEVSKEEREAGVKGEILGNGKTIGGQTKQPEAPPPTESDKDLDWLNS